MRITARSVAIFSADHFDLTFADLCSQARPRHIARARQVTMYCMRLLVPRMSLPAIGAMLGGRDHTTVLHGIRAVEALMKRGELIADVDRITAAFAATSDPVADEIAVLEARLAILRAQQAWRPEA